MGVNKRVKVISQSHESHESRFRQLGRVRQFKMENRHSDGLGQTFGVVEMRNSFTESVKKIVTKFFGSFSVGPEMNSRGEESFHSPY